MASVNEQQSASTVASTVIAPPSPLKVHKAGYGVGPEPSKPTGGLNISDKPLFPPRTSSSSTVPDLVKPTGSVFPPEDALPPRPEKARRASRVFHSSMHQLKRMSLTPADMLYPTANIYRTGSNRKAERMLGLSERQSPTIPAPPTELSSLSSYVVKPGPVLPQHHIATAIRPPSDPLNGRIAWFHALTSFLVVFNCWGLNTSFGLFQSYYSHTILANTSPSYIAWIGSTQLALVFLLGVPIGRAVDAGYFRPFFHGGSVLLVLGTFLTAQCRALWSLWLVQGLVTGLGMGCIFCSGVVVLMGWFDERKLGIAMGFAAAGSCLGAIVYTVMAEKLLVRKGFETTMRAMGAVSAVTMLPPNLVFRMRRTGQKSAAKSKSTEKLFDWRLFANTSYLLVAAGMFFAFLGVYFGTVYMVSYGTDVLHLSQSASVNLLIFMSAANLPGRFLPALISDRCIGPLNTIIPSAFLSSATIWLWAASETTHSSLIVIACFYGFVSAGIQVLYTPTVYSFCLQQRDGGLVDREGLEKMGVKAGGVFTAIGVACLVGTPIGGALIRYREEKGMGKPYLGAQIFAASCLLVAGMFLLASRVARAGWAATRA